MSPAWERPEKEMADGNEHAPEPVSIALEVIRGEC